jgi:hypothetical protein
MSGENVKHYDESVEQKNNNINNEDKNDENAINGYDENKNPDADRWRFYSPALEHYAHDKEIVVVNCDACKKEDLDMCFGNTKGEDLCLQCYVEIQKNLQCYVEIQKIIHKE